MVGPFEVGGSFDMVRLFKDVGTFELVGSLKQLFSF